VEGLTEEQRHELLVKDYRPRANRLTVHVPGGVDKDWSSWAHSAGARALGDATSKAGQEQLADSGRGRGRERTASIVAPSPSVDAWQTQDEAADDAAPGPGRAGGTGRPAAPRSRRGRAPAGRQPAMAHRDAAGASMSEAEGAQQARRPTSTAWHLQSEAPPAPASPVPQQGLAPAALPTSTLPLSAPFADNSAKGSDGAPLEGDGHTGAAACGGPIGPDYAEMGEVEEWRRGLRGHGGAPPPALLDRPASPALLDRPASPALLDRPASPQHAASAEVASDHLVSRQVSEGSGGVCKGASVPAWPVTSQAPLEAEAEPVTGNRTLGGGGGALRSSMEVDPAQPRPTDVLDARRLPFDAWTSSSLPSNYGDLTQQGALHSYQPFLAPSAHCLVLNFSFCL
jgi:hypothetical protein